MPFPITPEMVKEAYEKTGLRPLRGEWFSSGTEDFPGPCACGLSVLVAERESVEAARQIQIVNDTCKGDADSPFRLVSGKLNLTNEQAHSFVSGFDGCPFEYDMDEEAYNTGWKAARLVGIFASPLEEEA